MITTGLTHAAKLHLMQMLSQCQCKLALYDMTADIGPTSLAYTSVGEVRGAGYKAGGLALKNAKVWADRERVCLTWDSPAIPVATVSANGFMIYMPEYDNCSVFVGSWNATFTSTNGPFTVNLADDQLCLE